MPSVVTISVKREMSALLCLHGLIRRGGRKYCMPSQESIVKLLARYYSTQIKISQLNVWLLRLEDGGFISRMRRLRRGPDGRLIAQTTLYHIKRAGWRLLKRIGIGGHQFEPPRNSAVVMPSTVQLRGPNKEAPSEERASPDRVTAKRRLAELMKLLS